MITEGMQVLWKESRHCLWKTSYFLNCLMNPGVKLLLKCVIRHSIFVGTHFKIFEHKFFIYLHMLYGSPQKLARSCLTGECITHKINLYQTKSGTRVAFFLILQNEDINHTKLHDALEEMNFPVMKTIICSLQQHTFVKYCFHYSNIKLYLCPIM